jgi:hypothetical protein
VGFRCQPEITPGSGLAAAGPLLESALDSASRAEVRTNPMHLPDSWTERLPILEALNEPWEAFSRRALFAWIAFYLFFLYQQARNGALPALMNGVFVPIHEGGHRLFRIAGESPMVAGGTFLQLFAPFALAVHFVFRRQPQGVVFCMFFFFQQFLPISAYMADARAQDLPLLTVGDAEYVIHDWNYLFSKLGVLNHDVQIAGWVTMVGWLGMIGVCIWLIWRGLNDVAQPPESRKSQV